MRIAALIESRASCSHFGIEFVLGAVATSVIVVLSGRGEREEAIRAVNLHPG